uniref:Uncharacterized protein n=1 Tax=Oryza glaberrima TaxID=4538 RepID=I1PAL4_ORYGL
VTASANKSCVNGLGWFTDEPDEESLSLSAGLGLPASFPLAGAGNLRLRCSGMEMRECPQYPDLVRSNSRDFVGSLIKAWQKNLRSFQQLKIQITEWIRNGRSATFDSCLSDSIEKKGQPSILPELV